MPPFKSQIVLWATCIALSFALGIMMALCGITTGGYFWLRQLVFWGVLSIPIVPIMRSLRK